MAANPFDSRRIANMFAPRDEDPLMGAYRKVRFDQPAVQRMNTSAITQPEAEARIDPFAQYLERMRGGQAGTAYREHIGKMPTQEAYAPSKTRRFGGALAAAAGAFNDPKMGAQIGEQIINAPYRNALESWQMKGAGLKEQADIESQDVKGQIEWVKRMQDQQRANAVESRDIRRLELDEQKAETDRLYRQAQIRDMTSKGYTQRVGADGNEEMVKVLPNGEIDRIPLGPSMAGRQQADRERGTNISAYSAETGRGQLGVSQANLGMRGDEFAHRVQQDEILNQDRATGRSIQQQGVDIQRQNAGSAGYINAGEVFTANAMAAQKVASSNPKFTGWTLDESGQPRGPHDWFGTNAPDQTAKEFMNAVEEEKKNILSTRRPGVGQVPGNVTRPNLGGMGQGPIKFSDLPTGGGGLKF